MARPGRPAMPKPKLHPLVDSFLDMLTAERGAAVNTRQAYWRDLADFSVSLRETSKKEIVDATTDDIKAYLKDLGNKIHTKGESKAKIATRTVARRLSALRQFYRYLVSENVRKDDPTSTIDSPKQKRTLPKTLSEKEVSRLINTAGEGGGAALTVLRAGPVGVDPPLRRERARDSDRALLLRLHRVAIR